jgi:hypothetical protein
MMRGHPKPTKGQITPFPHTHCTCHSHRVTSSTQPFRLDKIPQSNMWSPGSTGLYHWSTRACTGSIVLHWRNWRPTSQRAFGILTRLWNQHQKATVVPTVAALATLHSSAMRVVSCWQSSTSLSANSASLRTLTLQGTINAVQFPCRFTVTTVPVDDMIHWHLQSQVHAILVAYSSHWCAVNGRGWTWRVTVSFNLAGRPRASRKKQTT